MILQRVFGEKEKSVSDFPTCSSPNRICTGHRKPGKSWNLIKGMESHGKAICFPRIKRQKIKKIRDKSETGFNFSTNRHKQLFYPIILSC